MRHPQTCRLVDAFENMHPPNTIQKVQYHRNREVPHLSHGKRGWIPSSMVLTPGNSPASAAENGPITSPSYGLTSPASAGTAPGTRASEIREKSPIIAKRPF